MERNTCLHSPPLPFPQQASQTTAPIFHLTYERGGLKLYYWAAHLHAAMCRFLTAEISAWIEIEKENTLELPLHLYLSSAQVTILTKRTRNNPFLKNTVLVGRETHNFLNETPVMARASQCFHDGGAAFPGEEKVWKKG